MNSNSDVDEEEYLLHETGMIRCYCYRHLQHDNVCYCMEGKISQLSDKTNKIVDINFLPCQSYKTYFAVNDATTVVRGVGTKMK